MIRLLKILLCFGVTMTCLWPLHVGAQPKASSMTAVHASVAGDLKLALESLRRLEEGISGEKLKLSSDIQQLQREVIQKREHLAKLKQIQDTDLFDFQELQTRRAALEQELNFARNTLQDFSVWLQSSVHPAELPHYETDLTEARGSVLSEEIQTDWAAVLKTLTLAEQRAQRQSGGDRYDGQAVNETGILNEGQFLQFGPLVVFAGKDESQIGMASSQMDSQLPVVLSAESPVAEELQQLAQTSSGRIPMIDPRTQSSALAMPSDSIVEQIKDGGFVMVPILVLALVAVFVCLLKMVDLLRSPLIPEPLHNRIQLLSSEAASSSENVSSLLDSVRGPVKGLLETAHHASTSEELLFHKLYSIREELERRVSLLAVIAASAPLLGLLGTVVGMIKTFEFITVFGVGDPRHLSGGISEALITTKFGLGVAIPCLLAHAYFQRKVKGRLHQYEHLADLVFEANHRDLSKSDQ